MAKKGENIYKRKDGRWEGRYIKKRTPANKIVYGYVYGKKYKDVKEKLTLMKAKQLTSPTDFQTYQGTYEEWIAQWFNNKIKRSVKSTTQSNYFRLLSRHILPVLGKYRLHQLQSEVLQQFVDSLIEQSLSSGSIRLIFSLVKQSLNEAVKQKFLSENPCIAVELPKHQQKAVHALSIKEQRELERIALKDSQCSPIILALYSGMRIGEISGLRWSDIDFDQNLIHVNCTISRIIDETSQTNKTELVSGTPKTEYSSRIIPLAVNLRKYLLEKKLKADSEYVIQSRGKLAEPRVINYRFKKLIQTTSFASIHFHVLRHTFATRCLEQGVDITSLSRLLGHRSTKLTLDTYTDSILEHRQEVMRVVDSLLEKNCS